MRDFSSNAFRFRNVRWIQSALLVLVLVWSFNTSRAETPATKYYRLTDIDAGELSIRSARVSSVQVQAVDPTTQVETVVLHIATGALTLICGVGQSPCLAGAIVPIKQERGSIRGQFSWHGSAVSSIRVTDLRLQLRDATIGVKVLGGILEPDRSTQVSVKVGSPLDLSSTKHNGSLNLTIPHGRIRDLPCKIGSFAVKADSRIELPAILNLDLGAGSAKLKNGRVMIKAIPTVGSIESGIQLYQTSQKGPLNLTNMVISIAPDAVTIGEILANDPLLTHADSPTLPVVGAAHMLATGLSGNVSLTDLGVEVSNLKAKSLRIVPDALEIASRLNQYWIRDSDSLLPTGDPNLRYIKMSALNALYRNLADAEIAKSDLYRVYLHISNDVVVAVQPEIIASPTSGGMDTPKVCLVFDGPISGPDAAVAGTYMLNMAVPITTIRTENLIVLRQLATVLGPSFGMPAFYTVLGSTKTLTPKLDRDMNKFILHSTKQYAELLLGTGQPRRVVVLPSPADAVEHHDQMISRYESYVSTVDKVGVPMSSRNTSDLYRLLEKESSLRVQYRKLVKLRANAWKENQQSNLAKLKAAEAAYVQASAAQRTEDQRHNAAVVGVEVQQMEDRRARLKAIQDTLIVSTPTVPIDGYPGEKGYTVQPCKYPGKVPNYAGTSGTEVNCQ